MLLSLLLLPPPFPLGLPRCPLAGTGALLPLVAAGLPPSSLIIFRPPQGRVALARQRDRPTHGTRHDGAAADPVNGAVLQTLLLYRRVFVVRSCGGSGRTSLAPRSLRSLPFGWRSVIARRRRRLLRCRGFQLFLVSLSLPMFGLFVLRNAVAGLLGWRGYLKVHIFGGRRLLGRPFIFYSWTIVCRM